MADTIAHRGPDDEGFYVSGQIGLGFRRLSIIDLGGGHQPLSNEDGSVWIVFNGEIYNYLDLRKFLLSKGHVFRTKSDTEVIVHLYEELGEACVKELRGMFAFAIWNERQKTLFLARDRVGIKPLYYRLTNRSLIFASEIKAILADPEVNSDVAVEMIDRFLTYDYLPGDATLFCGIQKLEPGFQMTLSGGKTTVKQYWDLQFSGSTLSLQDAELQLVQLLDEAVQTHMISDVPVGFLLSGGVDSTAMLSFAVGKTDRPLSSYTLGFSSPGITDERPYARLAAQRYGAEYHEMTITSQDFLDFLPKYVWHMEEPVCEPPAVALYYVSRMAKEFVKVLISGEGGDEAFAGYPNYRNALWLERFKSMLGPLNGLVSSGLSAVNQILNVDKIHRYAPLMKVPFDSYYQSRTFNVFRFSESPMSSLYSKEFAETLNKERSNDVVRKFLTSSVNGINGDQVNRMLYVDTKTWLPDDLLLKADKMTMANSIELRVPFLDHKLLEFAASLPGEYKVHGLSTKYIAKRALQNRIPREIRERKKVGFPVPYALWLRTDLKEWLRDVLLDSKSLSRGYFQKRAIEKLLSDNLESGKYSKELFSLTTLELWHRTFLRPARVL